MFNAFSPCQTTFQTTETRPHSKYHMDKPQLICCVITITELN